MSAISNIGGSSPVNPITPPAINKTAATKSAASARGADRLELSGMSHLLKTLKTGGDIRADKVAHVKAQIESGAYENDQKLDVATNRLLDDLLK